MSSRHVALAVVLLAGCPSFAMGAADRTSLESATLIEECPLGVPWTSVHVTETSNALVVDFTTSLPSNVGELRARVREEPRAKGPDHRRGEECGGDHCDRRDGGLRLWTMGAIETEVVDTPAGARILVAPVDRSRFAEVRERIARRVAELEDSDCPE